MTGKQERLWEVGVGQAGVRVLMHPLVERTLRSAWGESGLLNPHLKTLTQMTGD